MRLNELSGLEGVRLVAEGKVTVESLAEACLERIRDREETVKAWEWLDSNNVIQQAKALDRAPSNGPLRGILIGVKDIIDTADMPTAYGSPIYANHRPAWDASCVAQARSAGAIIVGKTVTTEFANIQPGKTRNPHNPEHTPSGSSSGSAAAVADFMVPLALGTQTGGSLIKPASYCGVVGYKPTFGLINRTGVKPVADSLDTIGVMARNVQDAAFFVAAITGRSSLVLKPLNAPPRIGLCRTHEWSHAAPETVDAFEEAGKRLQAAGATVKEIILPKPFARLSDAYVVVELFESAQAYAYEFTNHLNQISQKLRKHMASAKSVTPEAHDQALALAAECRNMLTNVLADIDALLVPSTEGEAPPINSTSTGSNIFNRSWTLLHSPCVNIPAFTSPNGLPVGLQMIAAPGQDAEVLAASNWALTHLKT